MSVKGLTEESIIELVKNFVRVQKEYHRVAEATWADPWHRIGRHRKEVQFRYEIDSLSRELLVRYEGIMRQIYRHSNPQIPALTNDSWQVVFDATWLVVQDKAVVIHDYRDFFGALWSAYSGRMKDRAAALPYKPRFMLLPFVDEMPEGDEQNVLLAAYGGDLAIPVTGRDLANLIKSAFPILHIQLLSYATDLEVLTAGVTCEVDVKAMVAPFDQLRRWLFQI